MTDPDSRRMMGNRRYIQGYNAQAVVNEQQIVIVITADAGDFSHLRPMLTAAVSELEAAGIDHTPEVAVLTTSSPSTGSKCSSRPTPANARANDPAVLAGATHSCAACSPATSAARRTENARNRSSRCSVTPNTIANSPAFTEEAD